MFCTLCQKWNTKGANGSTTWITVGCSSTRLDIVVKHEQPVMHKDAVSQELRTEADIDTAFKNINANSNTPARCSLFAFTFLAMLYLRYLSTGISSRAIDGKPIIFAKVSLPGNYGR